MAKTPAERQRDARDRRAERFNRMEVALTDILERLKGNGKALAVELREIAERGLAG